MESIVNYYYNLKVDNIVLKKDYYFIKADNTNYILKVLNEPIIELEKIINILNTTNITYHLLVLTKEGKTFFTYENKNYVLLKIRCILSKKISLFEFNKYPKIGICNWGDMWIERVDYYESQVEEIIKNKEIKYALEYYIGLTDISIQYYNNLKEYYNENGLEYSLSHRHLTSPINSISFYDPTNIIIDLKVRDIAEYLKESFFSEILTESEILSIIDNIKLNNAMANYLFLRLLYPSYFFNLYDEYIETKNINNNIYIYIKKSREYESLLSKIYSRLVTKNELLIKLWFIKSLH